MEKTGVPEKTLDDETDDELQKMPHTRKAKKFKPLGININHTQQFNGYVLDTVTKLTMVTGWRS